MKSFITGSRCYGAPNSYSDIDLVVRMTKDEAEELIAHSDKAPSEANIEKYGIDNLLCIRFGNLNMLICTNDSCFLAWKIGTEKCYKRCEELNRPLSRKEAVAIFTDIFCTLNQ